jgi:replication-associated recombination protein RarA
MNLKGNHMSKFRRTVGGHDPLVLVSMVQKSVRRNRVDLAAWAAFELLRSNYADWVWRRVCVTAAEDTAALVQTEINALRAACDRERRERKGAATRVFMGKALLLLCRAPKSRDPDHLANLVVDRLELDDPCVLAAALEEAEAEPEVPGWVFDCHTSEGRRRGKTRDDFFKDEHDALTPRLPGLFDHLVGPKR